MNKTLFPRSSPQAFSLVEVTLALGIIAFCLVALFGLLPVGLNSNQMSINQTSAASAAASVAADLRATPRSMISEMASPVFRLKVPIQTTGSVQTNTKLPTNHTVFLREDGSPATPAGSTVSDLDADPTQNPFFRVTVSFYPPIRPADDKSQRNAIMARILVTWPAMADSKNSATPSKYTGAFETIVALDRN